MSIPDIVTMLQNLVKSTGNLQHITTGFSYLLGILFIYTALSKWKKVSGSTPSSPSQVKMAVPLAYFLAGGAMLFLPTMVQVASNTFFGAGTVLSYASFNQVDIQSMIYSLIKLAGVIWFVRGCVLIAHGSNPGFKHGFKGWVFLFSGIFAMNFQQTQLFLLQSFQSVSSFFATSS